MGRKVVVSQNGPPVEATDAKRRFNYAEAGDLRMVVGTVRGARVTGPGQAPQ